MITRVLRSVFALLVCWVALLAGVMYLSDAAPAAVVLLPDAAFMAALPQDVAITGRTAVSVTLSREGAGLAHALYQAGASIVLPAGLLGCAPLTS